MNSRTVLSIVVALAMVLTVGLAAAGQHESHQFQAQPPTLVDIVRAATERFLDPEVAVASGYVPKPFCVTGPDQGAMGVHYVNGPLVVDGQLDPEKPESLVYESRNGRVRLVAVEYIVFADAWHARNSTAAGALRPAPQLHRCAEPVRQPQLLRNPRMGVEGQSIWDVRRLESQSVVRGPCARPVGHWQRETPGGSTTVLPLHWATCIDTERWRDLGGALLRPRNHLRGA